MPVIGLGFWIYCHSDVDIESRYYSNKSEYLEHIGDWLIRGKKSFIESAARRLRRRVGKGIIHDLKYSSKPEMGGKDYLMAVYCDDRRREEVKKDLNLLGARKMEWRYQRKDIEVFSKVMEAEIRMVRKLRLKHKV